MTYFKLIVGLGVTLGTIVSCGPVLPPPAVAEPSSTRPQPTATSRPNPTPTESATHTPTAESTPAAQIVTFSGTVQRGQSWTHNISERYSFELVPLEHGWHIAIRDADLPGEDLTRLTPPYHIVPNPRYIEGWHFRNADNTGPNDGSVNAPQQQRQFIFSPQVGRTIQYPPTPKQIEQVRRDGEGVLNIINLELDNLEPGQKAHIKEMAFDVTLQFR